MSPPPPTTPADRAGSDLHPSGNPASPQVVVLAGPTAVGKGTVVRALHRRYPQVLVAVSATTRAPRPGEIDGVDYHFVDDEGFDRLIAERQLLEWALVHGQARYGTLRGPVEAAIAAGQRMVLELDVQGARQVRASMPEVFQIFLLPPSWEELVRRLTARGTESADERARRLETARTEMLAVDEFDAHIVNRDVEQTVSEVAVLMGLDASAD